MVPLKGRQPHLPTIFEEEWKKRTGRLTHVNIPASHLGSISLFCFFAGLFLFLFFFKEQSPSNWLVTNCVSGRQRSNTDPLCKEVDWLSSPLRGRKPWEMHLDGAERGSSSCQRVSTPRGSESWEREEANPHPKTVSVTLGDLELALACGKTQGGDGRLLGETSLCPI